MTETAAPPEPPQAPPPPPPSAPPPPSGGEQNPNRTVMLVLSYLWLLALIPFLLEKDDAEVKWHARHGLVLVGAEIVLWIALIIVGSIVSMVDFGCSGCILQVGASIAIIVVHIMCIVKAVGGGRFLIPGISEFADKI